MSVDVDAEVRLEKRLLIYDVSPLRAEMGGTYGCRGAESFGLERSGTVLLVTDFFEVASLN